MTAAISSHRPCRRLGWQPSRRFRKASGGYILNDILDLEADRRHASKRHRPFASGALPPALGVAVIPILIITAISISWLLLPLRFVAALMLYVVFTTAYSLYLKRIAVLDVLLLEIVATVRDPLSYLLGALVGVIMYAAL